MYGLEPEDIDSCDIHNEQFVHGEECPECDELKPLSGMPHIIKRLKAMQEDDASRDFDRGYAMAIRHAIQVVELEMSK